MQCISGRPSLIHCSAVLNICSTRSCSMCVKHEWKIERSLFLCTNYTADLTVRRNHTILAKWLATRTVLSASAGLFLSIHHRLHTQSHIRALSIENDDQEGTAASRRYGQAILRRRWPNPRYKERASRDLSLKCDPTIPQRKQRCWPKLSPNAFVE